MTAWTIHDTGYDNNLSDVFDTVLKQGSFPKLDGSDLVIELGDYQLHLHGTFIIQNNKAAAGFITGFDLDYGPHNLVTGSGYNIDYADFVDALTGDIASFLLNDMFFGEAMNITGSNQADTFHGGSKSDHLSGAGGNDAIGGGGAGDYISGGLGRDSLSGAGGGDKFIFDSALGANNVDRISDFKHGTDQIWLDTDIFTALNAGALPSSAFVVGTHATDAKDRIIYNAETGALYYDADGAGGGAKVKFATLDEHLNLKATDFLIGDF